MVKKRKQISLGLDLMSTQPSFMDQKLKAAKRGLQSARDDIAKGKYPTGFDATKGLVQGIHSIFYLRRNRMYDECKDDELRDALGACKFQPHWPDMAAVKEELDSLESQIKELHDFLLVRSTDGRTAFERSLYKHYQNFNL
jgi:hypothetical protein